MEKAESRAGGITSLLKTISNPDAFKLFNHTRDGIKNSTYAIAELDLTPKRYYARLRELVDIGLVRKMDSGYRQTALGKMICDRFLPAMGKAYEARDELELLEGLEEIEMENGVRKRILEELGIPIFEDFTNVKLLRDYEALAIAAIDLYDSAEESVFLASNYVDVRVIESFLRAIDRGVTNRAIMGKNRQSSKLQNLRMMLSVTFAKAVINFASNTVELNNTVRFADLPYTFCVVDGHQNIIEISNTLNESFIFALLIDDRVIGEKLTKFFETVWKAGEFHSVIDGLNYVKSS